MFENTVFKRVFYITCIVGIFVGAGMIWWSHYDLKHFLEEIKPIRYTEIEEKQQMPRNIKIQEAVEGSDLSEQVDVLVEQQATEHSDLSSNNELDATKDKPLKAKSMRRKFDPVSPYGFGPYPEVPEEYMKTVGTPSWMETKLFGFPPASREQELLSRVMLKTWKEGNTTVEGAILNHEGRILINYKNRAYVRYATGVTIDGRTIRYIARWTSGSLKSPSTEQLFDGYIPSGVELIDLDQEDPTIDPYEFLGL